MTLINPPVLGPTSYGIVFLLNTYKTGIYDFNHTVHRQFARTAADNLVTTGYLDRWEGSHRSFFILTEKGAAFVREHFLRILSENSLYRIHAILLPGDLLRADGVPGNMADTVNLMTEGFGYPYRVPLICREDSHGEATTLPAGTYRVDGVTQFTLRITGTDPENTRTFTVNTYRTKDRLRFMGDNLGSSSQEMERRFGKIHLKRLLKRLDQIKADNLSVIEMLHRLRVSSVSIGRLPV